MAQRVERWTCDQQVVGLNLTGAKLRNNLEQVVHAYVPLSLSSITYCSAAGKVTAGLAESNGSLLPGR